MNQEIRYSHTHPNVSTPTGVLVRVFIAISLCWFFLPWVVSLYRTRGADWIGAAPQEGKNQLRSIRRRLDRPLGHTRLPRLRGKDATSRGYFLSPHPRWNKACYT